MALSGQRFDRKFMRELFEAHYGLASLKGIGSNRREFFVTFGFSVESRDGEMRHINRRDFLNHGPAAPSPGSAAKR